MASSSPWEEMEENYFICPICLDNLKDPKLLPCLHRYCRPCLAPIVRRQQGEFDCPMCKTACIIPENGVDGFKTDFHVQNMLEYIALQKTVKAEQSQMCKGCKRKETVIAYCFKCKGFLCDQWYQFHFNNDIFHDHDCHVLLLADITDRKLSLQKLASLKIAPRCHVHTGKPAEVCCETCNNLPICVVCGHYGEHKGHQISDVKKTAMKERVKIRKVVGRLDQYKKRVYALPGRLEEATERLGRSLSKEKQKLQSRYQEKLDQTREMLKRMEELLAEGEAKIEEKESVELTELQKERSLELEAAAKRINEKFDELENELKGRCKFYREEREQMFGEKRANLEEKLAFLDQAAKDNRRLIDTQGERAAVELADTSSESEGRIKRLDNFTSTVSSILAAEDDWTDSQCLPDVRSASGPLEGEVKKELLERDTISAIDTPELPSIVDKVTIEENPESVVKLDVIKHKGGFVMATTADAHGRVVFPGKASSTHAFFTAVDVHGTLLWRKSIEITDKTISNPKCYSAVLTKQLLVNACTFNEVSICRFLDGSVASTYDFSDEATDSTHGGDITNNWKQTKLISCVTGDPANKDVYIGSSNRRHRISREMLVLNDKLKYKHIILLPDDICWARDITFHRGHLLICDYDGKEAYIVSVDRLKTEIVHRLTKPTLGDGDWCPLRVCTDSKEFIYILWTATIDNKWKCVVTQYSPDSLRLLMTKQVDEYARGLTATFIDGKEKMLVTTYTTWEMNIYDLVTS